MIPPVRPLRTELNEALVVGIRERGAEAFGFVIFSLARIAIAVVVLGVTVVAAVVLGVGAAAGPFAGMTGVSATIGWLLTPRPGWVVKRRCPERDSNPQAPGGAAAFKAAAFTGFAIRARRW